MWIIAILLNNKILFIFLKKKKIGICLYNLKKIGICLKYNIIYKYIIIKICVDNNNPGSDEIYIIVLIFFNM